MTRPSRDTREQIVAAYRRMAEFYRPAAPSDGFGNITVPFAELDLDAEAVEYAGRWWRQEDEQDYFIGCPGWEDRPALIFTVEAAGLLCGASPLAREAAAQLLRLALAELEGGP